MNLSSAGIGMATYAGPRQLWVALGIALLLGGCASAGSPGAAPSGVVTAAMIQRGAAIYGGQGRCATCHGTQGQGTLLGPSLADAEWIHGDGSLEFIAEMITRGVEQPDGFPRAMPPKGGADIDEVEVRAVAAYVQSLSGG